MPNPIKELPFPWTCGKCGERAVERETLPYSTVVQYDGRGYTVEVPEFRVPRCKNCGAMVFDDPANDQITDALRRQVGLLPPERIRGNRESLGLTQRDFAGLLGVGESTVSRWETGSQIQQKSLDRLMRVFFAFPEVRKALVGQDGLADLGMQVIEGAELRDAGSTEPDTVTLKETVRRVQEYLTRDVEFLRDLADRAGSTSATQSHSCLSSEGFVAEAAHMRRPFSGGEGCRRIWLIVPLGDARRSDVEQAGRLSQLASRLDAVAEGKRESVLEEFQRLAELMTD